jgi:hypothetical protein
VVFSSQLQSYTGKHSHYVERPLRPGHQLFIYLRDPSSGLRLELFTDMAHIDDEDTYQPIRREIDRVRSVNMWGPAPPESFM